MTEILNSYGLFGFLFFLVMLIIGFYIDILITRAREKRRLNNYFNSFPKARKEKKELDRLLDYDENSYS